MFELSLSKLLLVFIIALIVLGPTKFIDLMKVIIRFSSLIKRNFEIAKNELNNSLNMDDIKNDINDVKDTLSDSFENINDINQNDHEK